MIASLNTLRLTDQAGSTSLFGIRQVKVPTGGLSQPAAGVGALSFLVPSNNLSDLTNAGTARTNLGLGALATQSAVTSATATALGGYLYGDGNTGFVTAVAAVPWGDLDIPDPATFTGAVEVGSLLATGTVLGSNLSGTNTGDQTITLTGDATGSGTGTFATTLSNSGVSAGTYRSVTADAKGRVTAGTNPTTISGYGLTDAAYRPSPTAVKTADYTASANELVPVDTTAGSVTVTLPTAPADGTVQCVKHVVQGGANTVTVACGGSDVFNKTGGATSATLSLLGQAVLLQYKASGAIWYVVADDVPLSQMDLRFSPLAGSTSLVTLGTVTTGAWTGTKIAEGYGGTNQATYATGDTLYASAANTLSKLAGNTTTTRNFLRQTGNGSASAAPAWDTVTKTDVGLSNVENTALSTWAGSTNLTTLGTITTGTWNAGVLTATCPTVSSVGLTVSGASSQTGDLADLKDNSGNILLGVTAKGCLRGQMSTPSQITSDQNNYAPTAAQFIRLSSDAARNITGMSAGVDGEIRFLVNAGSFNITLNHQSASSTAANRFLCNTGTDLVIAAGDGLGTVYDNTTQRWRVYG